MSKLYFTTLMIVVSLSIRGNAQDLVYKPINPAFGGETFNYQWLLSSASEQNKFKEEKGYDRFNKDPIADFKNSLNRQILSQLSRSLVNNLFGEEGELQEGMYEIGDFQINISPELEGVSIHILNVSDGSETSVIVPYY